MATISKSELEELLKIKDNYNEIIQKRDNKSKKHKSKNTIMVKKEIPQYVYRFLNRNFQVVYIGQTDNLDRRIYGHCVKKYRLDYDEFGFNENDKPDVEYIQFTEFSNKYWSSVYELHLTSILKPKYNKDLKYLSSSYLDLDISKLKWHTYVSKSLWNAFILGEQLRQKFYLSNISVKPIEDILERGESFDKYLNDFIKDINNDEEAKECLDEWYDYYCHFLKGE